MPSLQASQTTPKPFLKWAGGKSKLVKYISELVPFEKTDRFTYVEPFVGGGAVLFWILREFPNIEKAIINDVNSDLIGTYQTVKGDVRALINVLACWQKEFHSFDTEDEKKKYYYAKRELFNSRTSDTIEQSALFIFLNKTGFNGLYRVNSKNQFNVPMGSYSKPMICDEEGLKAASTALDKVIILNGDFEKTSKYGGKKALYYFDPPYKPLSVTSSFNTYAKGGFLDKEQVRLKEFCDRLGDRKSKIILSNSDVRDTELDDKMFFDDLYESYCIRRIYASRAINSKATNRGKISELLISNFLSPSATSFDT